MPSIVNSITICLLIFGWLSAAFHFTDDDDDGLYFISLSDEGKEVHEKLEFDLDKLENTTSPPPQLARRFNVLPSNSRTHCDPNAAIDKESFYQIAYNKFWFWCQVQGMKKHGKGAYTQRHGNTVAFMCNYRDNACNVNEWADAIDSIGKTCPSNNRNWIQGGWVDVRDWKKSYGFTDVDYEFC
ncbi:hypothetical protein F4779DRAFT_607896 [Xylariaceae sp. FL0662B]|nr:hypothetical protein F4779DRAFT_607896 [Xylariaceae sp. FL0662B]